MSRTQVQTPQKTEVAYTAKTFEATDARDTAGVEGEPVQASAPVGQTARAELPRTASSVYAVGLAGLLLLGLGLALRASAYLTHRA